jgi:antitoxin component of MazEF toxin-antitoxin module
MPYGIFRICENMATIVKLRETGHSAVVTIPKAFLGKLNWQLGNYLKLSIDEDKLVVRKIKI